MSVKNLWRVVTLMVAAAMVLASCATPTAAPVEPTTAPAPEATAAPATEVPAPAEPFIFGMLLVGPYNDHGWSQAHYDAGQYVVDNGADLEMVYLDKVNPADRPGTTPDQLAEDLVAQGAQLIIFNSDDMKDASTTFAQANPEIDVIMASGDQIWQDGDAYVEIPNMSNVMGRMEYGKMIAGCAAALTTQTGKIGYLGPLINDETRRLAASAFLGARHCWSDVLGNDPADLAFKVTWIGFWFNIPGFTSDPTQVANDFFDSGYDVVLSGIDTTESLVEAARRGAADEAVWAIPYDYIGACAEAEAVCLGVPYFNWGPAYLELITAAQGGSFPSVFQWNGPDWSDINNPDTSAVGFVNGPALSSDNAGTLGDFIVALSSGFNLWTGPINLQDGTAYLADGEVGTDQQVWYLPQLLEGMEGQSVSE
ncbi:MAG TPA: BMP family ABC transporter substrate-binding protein [Anaerolineales bacterium]|nr:BMP family ABC transporter substrate-binding protein [Anaerolineales bacterium]